MNNADGWGLGYYTPELGASPFLYTNTIPAWNDIRLPQLASHNASHLVFAHVRATTEGSTSLENCHPFVHNSLMWMHNGGLGGWGYIRRRLAERLADRWYNGVKGGTDSEWAFALFMDSLERMGVDPSSEPPDGFDPEVLRKAMLKTIDIINELIDGIPEKIVYEENVDTRSLLNFCVSDGHSIICTRYINSSTDQGASLYYSTGTDWESREQFGDDENYNMERRDRGADVVLVASEPLSFERGTVEPRLKFPAHVMHADGCTENWINVPTNSILTIHNQTAFLQDIHDQFYNSDPWQRRSAGFVHSKGLVANEKTNSPPALPSPALVITNSDHPEKLQSKTHLGPNTTYSLMRSGATQLPQTATPASAEHFVSQSTPTRYRATVSSGSAPNNTDARSITISTDATPPPQRAPSQGNIKKKRMSLGDLPQAQGQASTDEQPPTPLSPMERNIAYGDPAKIAQFFPELTLG